MVARDPDKNPDERKRDPRDWTWSAVSSRKRRNGDPIVFHGAEYNQQSAINAGFESLSFVGCPEKDRRGNILCASRSEALVRLHSKFQTSDFER